MVHELSELNEKDRSKITNMTQNYFNWDQQLKTIKDQIIINQKNTKKPKKF